MKLNSAQGWVQEQLREEVWLPVVPGNILCGSFWTQTPDPNHFLEKK